LGSVSGIDKIMDSLSNNNESEDERNFFGNATIALMVSSKDAKTKGMGVGACVFQRLARSSMDDQQKYSLTLFEFLDNDQFSNLDSFLCAHNGGVITLLLSEDLNVSNNENNSNQRLYGKKLDAMI